MDIISHTTVKSICGHRFTNGAATTVTSLSFAPFSFRFSYVKKFSIEFRYE